ncbi:helix-turn-helix domain-containing protein [Tenacibaculum amylolyticum]|uniref:helix-turn-helix domain-containing protein n=1 Tax=Tenacibaculum amylolyticum TaxID=104269 RepID=UPI0038955754
MISTKTYIPTSSLYQFVDLIWVGQASDLHIESSHYAPLFTELIFNYGDTFEVEGENVKNFNTNSVNQVISGLKTTPFHTKVSGNYKCVGLLLKPFCFGILLNNLGTQAFEQISEIIYEIIFDRVIPNFEKLELSLLAIFSKHQIDSDLIKFENFTSSMNIQNSAMRDFNSSISITQKSFIQKFKRHYLLTPNEYFQLKKVNQSIQLIENNTSTKLTEIALHSGFYDQSHFIRTFKKFCGYSPKKHIKTH